MTTTLRDRMEFTEEQIEAHNARGNTPAGELDALAVRNAARVALQDEPGFAEVWVAISAATNLASQQVEHAAILYATLTRYAAAGLAQTGWQEDDDLRSLRDALCRFLEGHGVVIADVMEH